jgi:hypothetical protein
MRQIGVKFLAKHILFVFPPAFHVMFCVPDTINRILFFALVKQSDATSVLNLQPPFSTQPSLRHLSYTDVNRSYATFGLNSCQSFSAATSASILGVPTEVCVAVFPCH